MNFSLSPGLISGAGRLSAHRRLRTAAPIVRMAIGVAICMAWGPAAALAAPKLTTIWTFTGGSDGSYPFYTSLLPGPRSSLYGTTRGGPSTPGSAFQLSPPAAGSSKWTLSVLHSFTGGTDGGAPFAMVSDEAGNLFGEGGYGGDLSCNLVSSVAGCGMVFELSPPAAGATAWTETVLFTFNGTDGAFPQTGLARDAAGNLYGTTVQSANCSLQGCGVVFELSPPKPGQTAWTETTLHRFGEEEGGRVPQGIPVLDMSGAVYGVTQTGGIRSIPKCGQYGQCGYGTVYKLTPPNHAGGQWAMTTLWSFSGADGSYPDSKLYLDGTGNIFGLTNDGGLKGPCPYKNKLYEGCGTVFELSPPTGGHGGWILSTPWKFTGKSDGRYPLGAGMTPYEGDYLTTTSGDEEHDFGSIDMFIPPSSGPHCPPPPTPTTSMVACPEFQLWLADRFWQEKTLFRFTNDANGENPASTLLERGGVFYGETAGQRGTPNGPAAYGTVFSFTP